MLTNFLKNWIADVVVDVSKSLGLTKDNVSMSANDKVFEATITFDNGTEYVYYISAVENIRDGQIIFIDRIDGKGATKECRTKEQVYDFLRNDINTGLVAEATEILESQGYKVVLNEAFVEDDSSNIDIDSADDIFALGNDILKKAGFMNEDGSIKSSTDTHILVSSAANYIASFYAKQSMPRSGMIAWGSRDLKKFNDSILHDSDFSKESVSVSKAVRNTRSIMLGNPPKELKNKFIENAKRD